MNFVISSSELLSKLQVVGRVIATKNTLPILDDFLFDVTGKTLTIKASDLETTILSRSELINVDGNGTIAVEAKRLQEIIREFSEQPLTFIIDEKNLSVEIQSQYGKYSLVGHPADDFPKTPHLKKSETQEVKLSGDLLYTGLA